MRLLIEHTSTTTPPTTTPCEPASPTRPDHRAGTKRTGAGIGPEPDDHRVVVDDAAAGFEPAARPGSCSISTSPGRLGSGHALARPGDGDITLDELVEFLSRTGCQVRIQPLLDPIEVAPVDGYEIPQRLRAAVRARQIADVSPSAPASAKTWILITPNAMCPWTTADRPAQTRLGNLGPMARPGHRAVTHAGWAKHQPETGLLRAPLTNRICLFGHQPRHPHPGRHRLQAPPSGQQQSRKATVFRLEGRDFRWVPSWTQAT